MMANGDREAILAGDSMSQVNNILEFPASEAEAKLSNPANENAEAEKPAVSKKKPIGLALGGGAARGWAHIGVLRAIDEAGIPVQMIAGTSIGALVGGCYLAGKLDELEEFAKSINRWNILRYMDFAVRASGLISGKRLADRMDHEIGHLDIKDLDRRFVAVATDIVTGSEIWLKHGSLVQAIRASYALPGVFQPVEHFGRQLVDGALVNPVPVSVCRAFEAPIVVAVNLSGLVLGRASVVQSTSLMDEKAKAQSSDTEHSANWLGLLGGSAKNSESKTRLGMTGVMIEAFNIIQDRIARSRLAGEPPDLTIRPQVDDIGLSDFHKADEAIQRGYEMAKQVLDLLEDGMLEHTP